MSERSIDNVYMVAVCATGYHDPTMTSSECILFRGGVRVLNHEELLSGDVSLEYVSKLMHRRYTESPTLRRVLQTLWYQVNNGQEIYVIGAIQADDTVRGGTGWGAEFAKLCNKPLHVFDQDRDRWFRWTGDAWHPAPGGAPVISHVHFTG